MTKKTLESAIRACVNGKNKAFVPYIMAGDGGIGALKEQILFLQEAGVTAIELGIPFSDPVADGPVIQEAGGRALAQGVTLRKVLEELRVFRDEVTVPIVFMTYLNPILSYGITEFVEDCGTSGVSGLIIPDMPLEESALLKDKLVNTDIALIQLVTLTSPPERIRKITAASEGFVYAVTVNGTTGVRTDFKENLQTHLEQLKEVSPVPVLAGFGISTPEQVRSIGAIADGVIVGSAIVDALHRNDREKVKALVNAAKASVTS